METPKIAFNVVGYFDTLDDVKKSVVDAGLIFVAVCHGNVPGHVMLRARKDGERWFDYAEDCCGTVFAEERVNGTTQFELTINVAPKNRDAIRKLAGI